MPAGDRAFDRADEADLAAVGAVEHEAGGIDEAEFELALIELVGRAIAAVAAHDRHIEADLLVVAERLRHDGSDGAALRQPGHVVGNFFLRERR